MSIKPRIRNNIALNTNPEGCKRNIINQIKSLEDLPQISDKPLNVLIVGGSSGYGLASRIALTYKANAYTFNVSYESEPKGNRSGTAGYYNNIFFEEIASKDGHTSDDYMGDAFSIEAKEHVINHFKSLNKKIDLVIYSVASGVRVDPINGVKYTSSLKPIGKPYSGINVDIVKRKLEPMTLDLASNDEIASTIKVMGGEDYLLWAKHLDEAGVLNEGIQFVTYTYIGSTITDPIYKDGTIGSAKRDLESKNLIVNEILKKYNGRALISASKAVVTKASIFIPTMALYVSTLFKVMKQHGTHETVIEHKYRLFKDIVYNESFSIESNLIVRLDALELDPSIQKEVATLLESIDESNFVDIVDFDAFTEEFLEINGFRLTDLKDF